MQSKKKFITDKCQALIEALLKHEDNKYCVDCDAKGPRWASWNLGVFLCIRCAGIHRNLGVHISRVKSVNLDAWTPEHVAYVQRMGNSRARAIYEANLPADFRRPQTDAALETFIRAKYEHKKYIATDYVDPGPPEPVAIEKMEKKRTKSSSSTGRSIDISAPPTSTLTSTTPATSTISTPSNNNNKPSSSLLLDLDQMFDKGLELTPVTTSSVAPLGTGTTHQGLGALADFGLDLGQPANITSNIPGQLADLVLDSGRPTTNVGLQPAAVLPSAELASNFGGKGTDAKDYILSLYNKH